MPRIQQQSFVVLCCVKLNFIRNTHVLRTAMKYFGIVCFLLVVLMSLLDNTNAECNYQGQVAQTDEEFQIKGRCELYKCHADGNISAVGCAAVTAPSYCTEIPQDNSKPYPACCPSYDCPE